MFKTRRAEERRMHHRMMNDKKDEEGKGWRAKIEIRRSRHHTNPQEEG